MAYADNELFSEVDKGALKSVIAYTIQPKTFGSGSGTITKMMPVGFNTSTSKWAVFNNASNETATITSNATPATAGTFTLTVNGEETADIAFDATAAIVQAALEALGGIDVGDVVAAATTGVDLGDASAVVTITFQGKFTGTNPTTSADFSGLTGNAHVYAVSTAGEATNETHIIRGFAWPDDIVLDAADDVLGNVMLEGKIHIDEIEIPAGESLTTVKAALREGVRERGLIIEGLDNFR